MSKHQARSTKRRTGIQKPQASVSQNRRTNEIFQRATDAHRGGDLATAKRLYLEIVARDPRHADAWHLLGFAEFHSHCFTKAIQRIRQALVLRPDNGEYHHNLALALLAAGQLDEVSHHAKLARTHGYADAQSYLQVGLELFQQQRFAAAEAGFQCAISIDAINADAHYLLGLLRESQDRFDEAIGCYEQAVAARPTFAEALNNLGNVLRQRGQYQQAAAALQRALSLQPDRTEVHVNLGATYHAVGQLDLAIEHFQKANRGGAASVEVLVKLAAAHTAQDRLEEARQCYAKLEQLQPNQQLFALCKATLCPVVYLNANENEQVRNSIEAGVGQSENGSLELTEQELLTWAPPPPFPLQFFSGNLRSIKERFAALYRSTIESIGANLQTPTGSALSGSDGRIRIGFVVTPGKEGVFQRSMQGIIERLDAERFAPSIVCWQPSVQILEQAFQRPADSFVVLPPAWKPLAAKLLAEALDILYYFEIGTDSANYFLPFFRLAPIQCTSWGIQVTSGIPNVDHYLSSRLVEPLAAATHYSENLVLADTLLCFRTRTPPPLTPQSREHFGFTNGQHLYVCAQQLGKFHTDFDPLIAAILRRDEVGVLAITSDRSGVAARRLRERFSVTMPDVAARIVLLPQLEREAYRNLLSVADVLLDPPHFGGVNSTYDGLSYGKAIVTLPSGFHRGRYTLGCYRKLQLNDCVASSAEDYVRLAVRLATEPDYRAYITQRINAASPQLFEDAAAVSEHERLFEQIVARKRHD